MAGTLTVKKFFRPVVSTPGAGGEGSELEPADYLVVEIDRFSNGLVMAQVCLEFADYAGLEAEFVAGTATTVLAAAIAAEIAAHDVAYGDLTSAQRSYVGAQIAVA